MAGSLAIVPTWMLAVCCANWWPRNNGKYPDIERDVGELNLDTINASLNASQINNKTHEEEASKNHETNGM